MAKADMTPLSTAANIVDSAKSRYTTKEYNSTKPIAPDDLQKLRELLQFSPSSTNAQP
ncbi:MAG: nitroreductase family protein [Pseudomonadota bacterium]